MKNKDLSSSIQLVDKSWEDHPAIQWMINHGRTLLWVLAAIIVALILIFRMGVSRNERTEGDYLQADYQFQLFARPATQDHSPELAFTQLQAILERHPELHAKYDGLIAQTLLSRGETDKALPYVTKALQRTENENSPYYTEYSQVTLLISKKAYPEALERSLALQQKMSESSEQTHSFGSSLIASNLLRIALLQQELGQKENELATWEKWKEYLQGQHAHAFTEQLNALQIDSISLMNYIQAREI